MRRLIYLVFCLTVGIASAQNTTVTGNITDADAIAWANSTLKISLYNPNPQIAPTCNGVAMPQSQTNFTTTSDASGNISTSVCSTNNIVPALTMWVIVICSNTTAPCQNLQPQKINGGSLNLTSTISAQIQVIRLAASPSTRAYADVEIQPTPPPGGTYFNVTSNTTRVWNGTAWASQGGGGVGSGSVWQREGTILSPGSTEEYNASEPSLIYEGSPQILTGLSTVFKMWWNCGYLTTGLCYAESPDAQVWTRRTTPVIARANPGPAHGYVFHYGSTYYFYAGNSATASTRFDEYTSSDGITWTLAHGSVLTLGSGTWDGSALGNVFVIPSAGNWLMMYEATGPTNAGYYLMGTATSSDQGVTWVKYAGNPSLRGPSNGESGGPEIHLVGSTYYVWYTCSPLQGLTPTDICRAHSTDFNTWTPDDSINPTFSRFTGDEGVGISPGQVADPSMVQVGNTIYMIYDGVLAQNGTAVDAFHLKLATAPYTFAQLVQTNEGNSTNYHSGGAFNSLNIYPCVYFDNPGTTRVPCPTPGLFDIGLIQIQGQSGFPEINWNMYWDSSVNRFIQNGYAIQTYFDVAAGTYHFYMSPSGSANGSTNGGFDYYSINASSGFTFTAGTIFNGGATFNTNPLTINSNIKIASTGTALSRYARYAVTLSPAIVNANTCAAQSFTVTGVAAGDILIAVNKPTEQAGLSTDNGHVTGANTATINFCNNTASGITPTASEVYNFVVVQ